VGRDAGLTWRVTGPAGWAVTALPDASGGDLSGELAFRLGSAVATLPHRPMGPLWLEASQTGTQQFGLLRSDDGGHTWVTLAAYGLAAPLGVVSMEPVWEAPDLLAFPTVRDGWAVWLPATPYVEDVLFRSADGGAHWRPAGVLTLTHGLPGGPPPAGIPARLALLTPHVGWFVGSAYGYAWLYATRDGGRTWTNVALPIPAALRSWRAETGVPRFGTVSDGVLPVALEAPPGSAPAGRPPAAAFLLYQTTDGGRTWIPTTPVAATTRVGYAVWAVSDPAHAWVLGPSGLESTADGGRTWHAVASAADLQGVQALQFVTPEDGWAFRVTASGTEVWRSRDGGRTWTPLPAVVVCPTASPGRVPRPPGC
jgi:hypothetical protein